jgi:uncharacterized membrane protein YgaE (UPF0421/DUF939 family)
MLQRILVFLSILGIILGGMVAFANVAYFPMDKGVQLEEKVANMDKNIDSKLDRVLLMLESKKGN